MQAGKSHWLWLAIILDIPIIAYHSWNAIKPFMRFDHWSLNLLSWAHDDLILLLFFATGLVAIGWAVIGNRFPLLFWNLCYLSVHMTILLSSPLQRTTINFAIISGLALATMALYLWRPRIRPRASDAIA